VTYLPEPSDRRCPVSDCGKRMVLDVGQHADTGWVEMWHECLSDGYRELDTTWKRTPVVEVARSASGRTAAELLLAQRNGWDVPMVYDTTPFPKSEFDEEVASA
jgi:hypothetical protein